MDWLVRRPGKDLAHRQVTICSTNVSFLAVAPLILQTGDSPGTPSNNTPDSVISNCLGLLSHSVLHPWQNLGPYSRSRQARPCGPPGDQVGDRRRSVRSGRRHTE
jgi:hypothetical protein